MTNQNQEAELEAEAAAEFAAEKAARGPAGAPGAPKKRPDRAEARRNARAAADVAREFLAKPAPALEAPKVVPVEEAPAPEATARCACGAELGHAVFGVHAEGRWLCPTCFMRDARSQELHPVARAVDCPTCHRRSVDFSGRNVCPVCRAKGARPVRLN